MKTMLACAALLAALVASADAEVRYDRKLEAAVKARVAERIGEIRAGFDHGDTAQFVQPDPIATDSVAPAQPRAMLIRKPGSLTLAVDRKLSHPVF